MIYLDFETRSESDLKAGPWAYAGHTSTEVLCCCWAIDDGPVNLWHCAHPLIGIEASGPPTELIKAVWDGHILEAHNASFERAIILNTWPWGLLLAKAVKPAERWRCSAAIAASFNLPRALGKAASALRLDQKKDAAGHRLMLRLCKPNKHGGWDESPEDMETLWAYCAQDVATERAVSQSLLPLMREEQEVWQVDCKMNERGVAIDTDFARAALRLVEIEKSQLNSEVEVLTGGVVEKATQRARLVTWVNSRGVKLPNTQVLTIEDILKKHKQLPEDVQRVLEICTIVGKTSVKKYSVALNSRSSGDRLRNTQLFYGANTGRWSGKGVQPHNLPRGLSPEGCEQIKEDATSLDYEGFTALHGDCTNTLSKALRGLFIAPPGKALFVADYSSIEARVLFWLAGEEAALDLYRGGADLYVDMACSIYKCSPSEVNTERRWLAKQAVLGLGYGMGAAAFQKRCAEGHVDLPLKLCKGVVNIYRKEKYPTVVSLWARLEQAAIKAAQGTPTIVDKLHWFMRGRSTWPSAQRFWKAAAPIP